MKEEVIIKDYLMSWLKPKDERSFGLQQLDSFLDIFQNDRNKPEFDEDERAVLGQILFFNGNPVSFSTGYPQGDKETPKLASIYITEGGWQQSQPGGNYLGSHNREGRASTQITVTGIMQGDSLNFNHPSLMIKLITKLLIAGEGFLISQRIFNQTISETVLPIDQQVSYDRLKIPIRSLLFSYESRKTGVNTNRSGF